MEKKIDIAAILKDCPRGMELDSPMFEGLEFDSIVNSDCFSIRCRIKRPDGGYNYNFTKYGCWTDAPFSKCVIFPKGKTTWERFVSPCKLKDGDILATDLGSVFILNTHRNTNEYYGCYAGVCCDGVFYINEPFAYKECCNLATKEEREELFQTIKDNGYKWNAETKTLEKLVVPKFNVGDRIKNSNNHQSSIVVEIKDDCFIIKTLDGLHNSYLTDKLPFSKQDEWELVPDKFDINTLKTFDQVLVRLTNNCVWMPKLFSHYDTYSKGKYYPFVTIDNIGYPQCIPYKDNEHLLGTTNNCDEFYRVWKE